MKRVLALGVALWSLAQVAEAQVDPAPAPVPPPVAEPPPAPAPTSDPQLGSRETGHSQTLWQDTFDRARLLMERGNFSEAAADFEALIGTATREVDRIIAAQNASLCRRWVSLDARLVLPGSLRIEAEENRRTTGELATLYLSSVGYGLGSGIVVALYTDPGDAAGFILPTLGLAGASAGLVYVLDKNTHLGYGVPQSIVTGLYIGLLEGWALTSWHFASVRSSDEWSAETIGTLIWGSATAGAVIGGVLGSKMRTSPGRAAFVETAARWSAFTAGLAVGGLVGDSDTSDEAGFLAGAIGVAAGAVGGYLVAITEEPSVARARFIDLGGISGTLVAGGLFLAADDNPDGRDLALVTAAGMAGGVAIAYGLTRGMDKDPPPPENAAKTRTITTVTPTLDGTGVVVGLGGSL